MWAIWKQYISTSLSLINYCCFIWKYFLRILIFSLEWDLISIVSRKSFVDDPLYVEAWSYVNYDIVIRRKPTYYVLTFMLPCFIITSMNIVGVFSPFKDCGDREEKVSMGLSTLLSMSVVLTLIAGKMPKTSEGQPLLGNSLLLPPYTGCIQLEDTNL